MPSEAAPVIQGDVYSRKVGFIYIFNLIVGAGALTLPKAFAEAGILGGLGILAVLGFVSYITASFMIESMAAANALKKIEAREPSESTVLLEGERKQDQSVDSAMTDEYLYEITERTEMAYMADNFFSPAGIKLFYICIISYLYGDLAIYAVAVPKSLVGAVCPTEGLCLGLFSSSTAYYVFLTAFALLIGPFCYFPVSKTKYLQLLTTCMRYAAMSIMIVIGCTLLVLTYNDCAKSVLVSYYANNAPLIAAGIIEGKGISLDQARLLDAGGAATLFGGAIYSFVCHHSLPGMVTPIENKKDFGEVIGLDYVMVYSLYSILCLTATFTFGDYHNISDIYTLDFKDVTFLFIGKFLALFPVVTLSSSFPIIAVTTANNLRTLFTGGEHKQFSWFVDRIVFPSVTIFPPIVLAYCTENVEMLVSITGSYCGLGIVFVIPVFIVLAARKRLSQILGNYNNHHRSFFASDKWCFAILVFCMISVLAITYKHLIQPKHKL
eukprot:Nk52_evm86s1810 gene=Nk52_evmTU86s1810